MVQQKCKNLLCTTTIHDKWHIHHNVLAIKKVICSTSFYRQIKGQTDWLCCGGIKCYLKLFSPFTRIWKLKCSVVLFYMLFAKPKRSFWWKFRNLCFLYIKLQTLGKCIISVRSSRKKIFSNSQIRSLCSTLLPFWI